MSGLTQVDVNQNTAGYHTTVSLTATGDADLLMIDRYWGGYSPNTVVKLNGTDISSKMVTMLYNPSFATGCTIIIQKIKSGDVIQLTGSDAKSVATYKFN